MLSTIAILVLAASLGAMLYFSGVVAPMLFRTLDEAAAGKFLRRMFPIYFLVNGIAALIAAALLADPILSSALGAVGLAMLWCRFSAIPVINAARDAAVGGDAAAHKRFETWHRITVIINATEMLVFVAVIAAVMGTAT